MYTCLKILEFVPHLVPTSFFITHYFFTAFKEYDFLIASLTLITVRINHHSHTSTVGVVLTCGEGDVGQLGLGPDVMEKGRPAFVDIPEPVIQICSGGMHTVCLTDKGQVRISLNAFNFRQDRVVAEESCQLKQRYKNSLTSKTNRV